MADTDITYRGYLSLARLLDCQETRSDAPDELLFIVIHQASELWLKLAIKELGDARDLIAADALRPAFKGLARVAKVFSQLIQSWDVLSTMTPSDYAALRPHLGSSSGFQSDQYRMLEFILGNRQAQMVAYHAAEPEVAAGLSAELSRPSLYVEALRLLSRRGFDIPHSALTNLAATSAAHPAVTEVWARIYGDPRTYWDLYELAEELVDLEHQIQLWRFGHLRAVERIIGSKRGTGGTNGLGYLEAVLSQRFFPELIEVRTRL